MRAYKCLRPGRLGPFSGHRWTIGDWVHGHAPELCVRGIHACRVEDLPYWLTEELWEVELEGSLRKDRRKLVAERGRLGRRVDRWTPTAAIEYAEACAARARERAERADNDRRPQLSELAADAAATAATGNAALVGFIAARAAEVDRGVDGYSTERAAQARWLAAELGLEAA